MTCYDRLAHQLATTASGSWGEEAALWLLAEHGHWLPELHRVGLIMDGPDHDQARINWPGTESSQDDFIGTNSEHQVLSIARALVHQNFRVGLNPSELDEENRLLVLHAIAWAAGGRAWAKSLGLLRGLRCGTCDRSLKSWSGKDVMAHTRLHRPDIEDATRESV
ncbi:hypothetical protein [Streptomyces javensis]|uniref:C2H2-type domain-containing protein n=1 Tax=Streptomyces javensis TaxID=114698 RepID=A0ABS0R6J1_9ACTN|nr:hypothetical protein [Streptomyces javensis]MBI0312698.1 hypothetical protein [Streptomyces javensis]